MTFYKMNKKCEKLAKGSALGKQSFKKIPNATLFWEYLDIYFYFLFSSFDKFKVFMS